MTTHTNILKEIEALRLALLQTSDCKGYTHRDTVAISQQLDKVLNTYQARSNKRN